MGVPAAAIEEFGYLDEARAMLRRRYPGRFVVIEGRRLLGDFATEEEAFRAGVRACGTGPFLIAQLGAERERAWVPLIAEVDAGPLPDEDFVPHGSWRRGEFEDDPPVETTTPLPPGAVRRGSLPGPL